jgi:HSP20 family molecular chaperone IbpA
MGEATAVKRVEQSATPIKYGSLFDEMQDMFNVISHRAYEIFESNGYGFGRDLENWFQAERELLHPMPVNITETDSVIELKAEVPGFDEKEIEIGLEPRRLTISGKREATKEEKKGKSICEESCPDQIFRMLDLPAEIEPEKATAVLKNGVLKLVLPKTAKERAVKIHPKAA